MKEKVVLDVPFYSQNGDDVPEEWHGRACGITVLKMALEYYTSVLQNTSIRIPDVGKLIGEGVAMGGYLDNVGWKHDALVALAKTHGAQAHRAEFKNDKQKGVEELQQALGRGEVPAVSISTDHTDPRTFHLVALTGYDEKGFFYNDPARGATEGKEKFILYDDFQKVWRGLAVFFGR
ncbi:C39 family peptidase [Candidatus Wolfebacteria bacterium]|nr:C39 family peptidase [Candidatus Wolfebacteria bacterium]